MEIVYLVVNLDRSKDRLSLISDNLSSIGQSFTRVDAIDASSGLESLRTKIDHSEIALNRWMTPGAVACALSHSRAYEIFLSTGLDWCIISEDDVFFDQKLTEVIAPALGELYHDDIYFLHFQGKQKNLSAPARIQLPDGFSFHAVIDFCDQYGAVAYLVHRSMAAKLLRQATPVKTASDRWDLFQAEGILRGGWALLPQVSRPSYLGSDIGYQRLGKWLRKLEKNIPVIRIALTRMRERRRELNRGHVLLDQVPTWCHKFQVEIE